MRSLLVAGNWKMNGSSAMCAELVQGILAGMPDGDGVQLLVCPPFPYLERVKALVAGTRLMLGAQTVSEHPGGAYTGEIAASMLTDNGCRYVIVGHSERRSLLGETSQVVAAKFGAAQAAGLTPILCVGETLDDREAGNTEAVIESQLSAVIGAHGVDAFRDAVIAYEPVWAIGTGRTASPDQAQEVHAFIRGMLADSSADTAAKVQILYGGSVKGDNAASLFAMPDIDGGLIGGASLKATDFLAIAHGAVAQRN